MHSYIITLSTRGYSINIPVDAETEREARKCAVAEANRAVLHNSDDVTNLPGTIASITFRKVRWTARHITEVYIRNR